MYFDQMITMFRVRPFLCPPALTRAHFRSRARPFPLSRAPVPALARACFRSRARPFPLSRAPVPALARACFCSRVSVPALARACSCSRVHRVCPFSCTLNPTAQGPHSIGHKKRCYFLSTIQSNFFERYVEVQLENPTRVVIFSLEHSRRAFSHFLTCVRG